jgi:hypothetical protein
MFLALTKSLQFLKETANALEYMNVTTLRGTLLVAQLVEALRYKPEGGGFDSRWYHLIFFICIILPPALRPWGRLIL